MANIITIATPKGGSGKTTIAIILAGEFAHQGHKTLIIDTDRQQSAFRWKQKALAADKDQPNLEVVSATRDDEIISCVERYADFDAIIIDTAGFADRLTFELVGISDLIVIPCKISSFDADQVVAFINQIRSITQNDPAKMPNYKVVLNEYDPIIKSSKSLENVYQLFSEHNINICDCLVQKRERFKTITEGVGSVYLLEGKDKATENAQTNSRNLAFELINN